MKEKEVIFLQGQNPNKKIEEIWATISIPRFIKIILKRSKWKRYTLQIQQAKEIIIKIFSKLDKN